MLMLILIAGAVTIVGLVIVVAVQPAEFRITRSNLISAAPAVVFAQVNDLHKWEAWSPWAKMDPNAKNIFAGPPAGTGASMHWAGNRQVGEGIMTILESRPDELIRLKLEFLKPFKAIHTAEFTFKPAGDQTSVTWSMSGKNSFMGKAFTLVMDCGKMIGGQFEKGLAAMKSIAEAAAK
jgi:Polyketide cyclase / dehydrase and lipid transport